MKMLSEPVWLDVFNLYHWAFSADDKLMIYFSYFAKKTGFDISCKLSL